MQGTNYSEADAEGMDAAGPNDSQGYIAHTAAQAVIFIEAAPPVGLICVMPIGMAEVSACNLLPTNSPNLDSNDTDLGWTA